MKKSFRAGSIWALLLIFSLVLAACGETATPTTAPAPPTATTAAAPPTAMVEATATTAMVDATATTGGGTGAAKVTKVGLVTDVGSINDKSFNQSSWEGAQQAATALGAEAKYIETKDPKDYSANIDQLVTEGYNPIVTVGFAIGQATADAATRHPTVTFIGVDQFIDPASDAGKLPNYVGLIFNEDQAGFLAGALAAQMSAAGNIGAVLGTDIVPPVWRFGEGYKEGAKYIKADIKLQVVYHSDVDLSKTFNDPAWGKTTAISLIDKGADVIFGAGGNTGNGALQACAEQVAAGKTVYALGVDTDQYETVPEARPALLSSAMKLLTPGVAGLIQQMNEGTLKGGNNVGEVGLAPFHDLDAKVPAAVKTKLQEIEKGLKDGSIKTNVAPVKPSGDTTAATATPAGGSTSGAKVMKVGLVTDVGSINDKSFNQSSWEGAQQAATALNAEAKYIETKDPKDYSANIDQLVTEGYNPIVTVGFAIGQATADAATRHPTVTFIGVDQFIDPASDAGKLPNYVGLIFNEDQAGFLAGALAAQMSAAGNIGAVLGTDIVPPVWRFGEGYKAGAAYIKSDIKLQVVYHSDVDLSKTFNDPAWGKTTAISLIDKGADVIFGAGGNTGNGALQACAEQVAAGKTVYALGVDTDQYETVPEARPALLSSAMKLLTPGVAGLIQQMNAGTLKGGNNFGEVGLAPFHDLDAKVPATVKTKLEEIEKGLKDGSIKTNVPPAKPSS